MAELVMQEVESLTKTLQALSATKMQARYKLKQAHHHEDPLGSLCLQLHHEASLAEANFNAAVAVVELIGWKAHNVREAKGNHFRRMSEEAEKKRRADWLAGSGF